MTIPPDLEAQTLAVTGAIDPDRLRGIGEIVRLSVRG